MAGTDTARALLNPRSIALIGASGDETKNTARPLQYLRKHGFKGGVFPVNAGREEVLGEKAWPDLKSAAADAKAGAGGGIDHAYVMVRGAAVAGVIADCAAAGVKVASVYSDGFAETGEDGLRLQLDMVKAAGAGGVRVLGPNSMGVINLHAAMGMTTNAALETDTLVPGPFSVISQSGTALGALLSRGQARGFGFSKLVSIGNESDLSVGEIVSFLADDPDTGAILLFLETLRRTEDLAAGARRAFAAGKSVIAYKIGRSDAGRQMAVSHSGALAGPDEAVSAFFSHHGIIRVDTLEALLETPHLVNGLKPACGRRAAVMTTTGGGAAMVVDWLGLAGVSFASPPAQVKERLGALDIPVGDSPVVDLTMAGARADVYGPVLGDLIDDKGNDVVVCVVGSSAQFRPDVAVRPIIEQGRSEKPLAVFCVPEAGESLKALSAAGIAGFRTPESCADAVSAYLHWSGPVETPAPVLPPSVKSLLKEAAGFRLDEAASLRVFEALGIACVPCHVLAQEEIEGEKPPPGVEYPLCAKVLSADIAHKTEAGGVVLDIPDEAALMEAAAAILKASRKAHPQADITGVLVQRMESGLAEALVGYRLDPVAGPMVVLGAGGVLSEIHNDAVVRVAPVDIETARAMIEEVRGLAPIRGYRGMPEGDLDALAAAVAAVSALALAEGPAVVEAEINPLMVKEKSHGNGGDVVAVDGLIVLAEAIP